MAKSKIHKDEINWLIIVYNTIDDEELKKESFDKLIDYGFNKQQIKERFERLKSQNKDLEYFNKAWKIESEKNESESYNLYEKIKIFLFGPLELFMHYNSGLKELKDFNYKVKFRQRQILLIFGTIFWVLFCIGVFQYYEFRRIQEINAVDISDWENNRIGNKNKTQDTKNMTHSTDSTTPTATGENDSNK